METLIQDMRHAVRVTLRRPGLSAVVLATLDAFEAAGLVVSDAALREGVVLRLREGALGELRVPAGESGPPPRSEI